jgi:hypothetical protein
MTTATVTFQDSFRETRAAKKNKSLRKRTPLVVLMARFIARMLPTWPAFRRTTLVLGGFGSLTTAAWLVALPLGLLVLGISLLILDFVSGDGSTGDR